MVAPAMGALGVAGVLDGMRKWAPIEVKCAWVDDRQRIRMRGAFLQTDWFKNCSWSLHIGTMLRISMRTAPSTVEAKAGGPARGSHGTRDEHRSPVGSVLNYCILLYTHSVQVSRVESLWPKTIVALTFASLREIPQVLDLRWLRRLTGRLSRQLILK